MLEYVVRVYEDIHVHAHSSEDAIEQVREIFFGTYEDCKADMDMIIQEIKEN